MTGRTRRRPTSLSPDALDRVRSCWYHPKPSVGPNPGAGARPALTPNATPLFTSSSNVKMLPTDPPIPTRFTMLVIIWADAFVALSAETSTAHIRTRFLMQRVYAGHRDTITFD